MAVPLTMVLETYNVNNVFSFYPILDKYTPESMICQDLSSQIVFINVAFPFNLKQYNIYRTGLLQVNDKRKVNTLQIKLT